MLFKLVFITESALLGIPDSPLPRTGRRGVLKTPETGVKNFCIANGVVIDENLPTADCAIAPK